MKTLQKPLCICLLFAIFIYQKTSAQYQWISPTIPTPNAASLGIFGEIPVSHYSGMPQIGVPLHTIKNSYVEVPISLSYNASGYRPEVHPSWVGNNWALNAGGLITRVVKDVPDEYNETTPIPPEEDNVFGGSISKGFYYTYAYLQGASWATVQAQQIANGTTLDRQPDIFSFNFLGYTGKFYLDENRNWKVQCDSRLKVTFDPADFALPFVARNYGSPYPHKTFSKFTITDDKGVQYLFGTENGIEYSVPMYTPFNDLHSAAMATSWYLVKITPPRGREITFNYERGPYQSSFLYSQYQAGCYSTIPPEGRFIKKFLTKYFTFTDGGYSVGISGFILSPVYLTSISDPSNNCTIKFITSKSNELTYPTITNYPGFNPSVACPYVDVWRDETGNLRSPVIIPSNPTAAFLNMTLDIPYFTRNPSEGTPTPADFNTSKYIWLKLDRIEISYATAILASDYPSGPDVIRKKILFNYIENSQSRLKLNSIVSSAADNSNPQTYKFYHTGGGESPYLTEVTDHWGFSNGSPLLRTSYGSYTYISDIEAKRAPSEYFASRGMIERIEYPTGGSTKFIFESHKYDDIVIKSDPGYSYPPGHLIHESGIAGGLRVKKIENNDGLGNITFKQYSYSGGVLEGKPKYNFTQQADIFVQSIKRSNSMIPLSSNSSGQHISYSNITEAFQDGSRIDYKYSSRNNGYNDLGAVSYYNTGAMSYIPVSSTDIERGKILEQSTFSSSNKLLKKKVIAYQRIAFGASNSIRTVEMDDALCFYNGDNSELFPCMAAYYNYCHYFKPSNIKEYDYFDTNNYMLTETNNYYDDYGYLVKQTTLGSDNVLNDTRFTYPHTTTGNAILDAMTAKNMLDYFVVVEKYKGTQLIEATRNNYANFSSPSFIALSTVENKLLSANYRTVMRYLKYDTYGNLLEMQKEDDIKESFIWGYGSRWPIAKVTGNDYNTAIALVNQTTLNTPGANSQMTTQIANLRNGLSGFVSGSTYSIFGEVLSQINPSNKTIKYDYDNIGRLEHFRDQNNNILKKYTYSYQQQPYNQNVFYNEAIVANISRTGCGACTTPTAVEFVQPAGKFMSLSGQSAAQTLAQNDINTNMQTYAIANGSVCAPVTQSELVPGSGWMIPLSYFSPQGTVVNASMVLIRLSAFPPGHIWALDYLTVGTLNCPAGKPAATRTTTATEGGRSWQVEINSSGQVRIRLNSGTPPSTNVAIQFNFNYNL